MFLLSLHFQQSLAERDFAVAATSAAPAAAAASHDSLSPIYHALIYVQLSLARLLALRSLVLLLLLPLIWIDNQARVVFCALPVAETSTYRVCSARLKPLVFFGHH